MLILFSRSAQLTLQVEGEQGVGLGDRAGAPIEMQRVDLG
jgi:hypothetical protein